MHQKLAECIQNAIVLIQVVQPHDSEQSLWINTEWRFESNVMSQNLSSLKVVTAEPCGPQSSAAKSEGATTHDARGTTAFRDTGYSAATPVFSKLKTEHWTAI